MLENIFRRPPSNCNGFTEIEELDHNPSCEFPKAALGNRRKIDKDPVTEYSFTGREDIHCHF